MKTEAQWKKQGFKSDYKYREHLRCKSLCKRQKEKSVISKDMYEFQENLRLTGSKKNLCKSLQKLTSNVKDSESLFSDIEFIRKITGCKIPIKKKK